MKGEGLPFLNAVLIAASAAIVNRGPPAHADSWITAKKLLYESDGRNLQRRESQRFRRLA
jgi:hypothetical protein